MKMLLSLLGINWTSKIVQNSFERQRYELYASVGDDQTAAGSSSDSNILYVFIQKFKRTL